LDAAAAAPGSTAATVKRGCCTGLLPAAAVEDSPDELQEVPVTAMLLEVVRAAG
jgi:hypothetical protein